MTIKAGTAERAIRWTKCLIANAKRLQILFEEIERIDEVTDDLRTEVNEKLEQIWHTRRNALTAFEEMDPGPEEGTKANETDE